MLKKRKLWNYMNFHVLKKQKYSIIAVACILLTIFSVVNVLRNSAYEKQREIQTESIVSTLGSRNSMELVKPIDDTTIIKGELPGVSDPLLVVVVVSSPQSENRRNTIRTTWAKSEHCADSVVRFFMGKPTDEELLKHLEKESNLYGDIIVDDFEEHYYKLAIKSLRMLKWFLQHKRENTKFVAKVDDDVYVNVSNVISYIKRDIPAQDQDSFIGGQLYETTGVETNPYSKWYVPPELWTGEIKFPPFVGGPFYMMSTKVAQSVLFKSQQVPIFHLEDVYISGVLSRYEPKVRPKNIPLVFSTITLSYWPTLNYYYVKYFFDPKNVIAYHLYSVIDFMNILYESSID